MGNGCIARLKPPTLGALELVEVRPGVERVRVPVEAHPPDMPEGYEVRIEAAFGTTEPAEDSGLWRFVAILEDAPDSTMTPPPASGQTVYVRARGQALGYRHSSWGDTLQLGVGTRARFWLTLLSGSRLRWLGNPFLAGVRLSWAVHQEGTEPTYGTPVHVEDPTLASVTYTIPDRPLFGQRLSVLLEAFNGWDEGQQEVDGELGHQVEVSRLRRTRGGLLPVLLADGSEVGVPSIGNVETETTERRGFTITTPHDVQILVPAYRHNGLQAHVPVTISSECPAFRAAGAEAFIPLQEAL